MSVPTSSASTTAIPAPVIYQAPINVPLPSYDWNAADQMHEFRLFKCQLDTRIWLYKIKTEGHPDYLLCILGGKEGYAAIDCWVPTDEAHKQDPKKFLGYLESTADNEISPQVSVYQLEDIKKRSDKSIYELIDRIPQLTCHAQTGDGSNAAIKFEVQCRLIWAISDADIKLWKELLKLSCDRKVLHLLEISCMYYAIESGAAVMCADKASTKVISPIKTNHESPLHSAPTALVHTCHDNCPAWSVICKGCSKKGHSMCHSSGPAGQQLTKSDGVEKAPHHQFHGKGKKADMVQVNTEDAPPCNELFIDAVDCGTVGDTHPEEIVLDNVYAQWCSEAYTIVQLPASISSKGTASLHIKVETGA